jgi:hypothetical protein
LPLTLGPSASRCQMDLSEHSMMVGKLLVSFQCLEYALRAFLYEQRDPPHEPLAPGTDLNTMTFGEVVPENAITRWDSLTHLIKRYNRAISDGQLAVDPSLVDLRDALAHGRMAASLSERSFALIKFTRPYAGRVEVGFRQELSKEWIENQIKRVLAECEKVARAASSQK